MNQSPSKVETPREAPKAAVSEMARKLEALRNDVTPEKLAEAKIKADFGKLEGRIETATKARKASAEELAEINRDFEALRRSLEIKQFEEKLSASEAIIRYLQSHPEVKPESVKPSDVKITDAELQKPAVWKNILEDAVKGLAVTKLIEKPDFDWKKPETYLEKAGDIGNSIIKTVKEHPVASAVVLIGGIYALYEWMKKDSDTWDKVKGTVAAGAAVWAGMSVAGSTMHTDIAEKIARGVMGDKAVDTALEAKKKAGEVADEAGEVVGETAEGAINFLKKKLPKSAANIENLYQHTTNFNLIDAGSDLKNLWATLKEEDSHAYFELATEGTLRMVVFVGGKAVTIGWSIGKGSIEAMENLLTKSDNPWINNPASRLIVSVDKYIAGVGGAIGGFKALQTLFQPGKRGLLKTPIEVMKGSLKGATIGQYSLVRNSLRVTKFWPEMLEYYQSATRIGIDEVKYLFGGRQKEFLLQGKSLTVKEHHLKKIETLRRMQNNSAWLSKAERKTLGSRLEAAIRDARAMKIDEGLIEAAEKAGGTEAVKTKTVVEAEKYSFFKLKIEQLQGKTPAQIKALSENIESGIEKLETEISQLAEDSPERLRKLDEIKAMRHDLEAIKVYVNPKTYAEAKLSSLENFEKLDANQKALAIKDAAAQMESLEIGQSAQFRAKIEAAKKAFDAKELTQEQFQKRLGELDQEAISFGKSKLAKIKELKAAQNSLPKEARELLSKQVASAIDNMDNSLCTRVVKGVKGRAKIAVVMASAMFAIDKAIHWNDADNSLMKDLEMMGPDLKQLLLDVAPVAGTFSNFYSAFSGREYISGRDVSGAWDRVSNVIWGTVGAAGDTLTVLSAIPSGGASLGGAALVRLGAIASKGGKLARPAEFLIANWARVTNTAERVGGWRKFLGKLGESGKAVNNLRRIERAGVIAGTTMIAGSAVNLTYGFLSEGSDSEIPE